MLMTVIMKVMLKTGAPRSIRATKVTRAMKRIEVTADTIITPITPTWSPTFAGGSGFRRC